METTKEQTKIEPRSYVTEKTIAELIEMSNAVRHIQNNRILTIAYDGCSDPQKPLAFIRNIITLCMDNGKTVKDTNAICDSVNLNALFFKSDKWGFKIAEIHEKLKQSRKSQTKSKASYLALRYYLRQNISPESLVMPAHGQKVTYDELAYICRTITIACRKAATLGKACTLARDYFLKGIKDGVTYKENYKKRTGRCLNANKLAHILNVLAQAEYIERIHRRGKGKTYRPSEFRIGQNNPYRKAALGDSGAAAA